MPQFTEIAANGNQVASTQELNVVTGSQQAAISALQASINSAGQIILTGADASQLGGKFTNVQHKICSIDILKTVISAFSRIIVGFCGSLVYVKVCIGQ